MPSFAALSPLRRAASFLARLRAIRACHGLTDPDSLFRFFEPPSLGTIFTPQQKPTEIRELFRRVQELRPRAVLEIGTNYGGTLFLFCRAAAPDATVVSLDLPGGQFGGGYSALRIPYYRAFAANTQRLRLLRMDSHSARAHKAVRRALAARPLDFLFIDGDHSYAGVRQDFVQYAPLVRPGGLIAFHDVATVAPEIGVGVPQFWQEVKARHEHEEFVEQGEGVAMGVGLIRMDAQGIRL
jgi:predicted O-methyltransferase YrrM